MALVAGKVIDAAREYHVSFDPKAHPDKLCLGFLSRYVRQLHGKIVAIDPDAVRVEVTTALPLVDFDAGVALPANVRYVAEVAVRYRAPSTLPPVPLDVIQSDERNARNRPPGAVWTVGSVLFLAGNAQSYTNFDQIAISVVLLPVALAVLEDLLPVPDAAEAACVEAVAGFLAGRVADAKVSLTGAERAYLDDLGNNVSGRTFYTQDVWQP